MMWCANWTLLPTLLSFNMVSSTYPQLRRRFQSLVLSSRDDKLCGAGRNDLAVQSSSHFCVYLSFVLPQCAANRPCKHVRLQAAVHACKIASLDDTNSYFGNRNPCSMSISFVGSRCTACIHATVLLRSRGNAVPADAGQDIPSFDHSSGHKSRISRS